MPRLRELEQKNEQLEFYSKQRPKVVSCWIEGEKLIVQLNDEREIGLPVASLIKCQVIDENIKPEQLKRYELWGEGEAIFFPDADESISTWMIVRGLRSACRD